MISGLFHSTTIPVLEQLVNFSQSRHEILASNIANTDTPGYKIRDLSQHEFQKQMKTAIAKHHQQPTTGLTQIASRDSLRGPFQEVRSAMKGILYHDETNQSIEKQVAELTKNQLQHNLALSIMNNQFRLLQAAISERV